MSEIIEHMEHSKNPFERVHWQTCNVFWDDNEQDPDDLYETGKEVYEVGKQLLEACIEARNAHEAYLDELVVNKRMTAKQDYDLLDQLNTAIAAAKGGDE